jgi:hypothetical protein
MSSSPDQLLDCVAHRDLPAANPITIGDFDFGSEPPGD